MLRYDYLPLEEVLAVLRDKPEDKHVIVTGRNAKNELLEIADLVTEMTMVKHPFRESVKAQAGWSFDSTTDAYQGCHVHGHRLGCRQVDDRGRPLPRFRQPGFPRASVQAAEHVEQRGGDGGRWRNRPRPGVAGAGLPGGARPST